MSIVFFALPFALLIAGAALWAFIWATRTGQFDDLETPSYRAMFDDEPVALDDEAERPDKRDSTEKPGA